MARAFTVKREVPLLILGDAEVTDLLWKITTLLKRKCFVIGIQVIIRMMRNLTWHRKVAPTAKSLI